MAVESVDGSSCPGCSGEVVCQKGYPYVGVCVGCGGLIASFNSRDVALNYVNLNKMTGREDCTARQKYFDFMIANHAVGRVHGWYDPKTKMVTQYG